MSTLSNSAQPVDVAKETRLSIMGDAQTVVYHSGSVAARDGYSQSPITQTPYYKSEDIRPMGRDASGR